MGRRPRNAERERPRLAAKKVRKVRETLADRLGDHVHGDRMRFAARAPDADDGLKARGSFADHSLGSRVEAAHRGFACELDRFELFRIAGWAAPARFEQAERALEAGNARCKLAARDGGFGSGFDRKDLEHRAQHRARMVNKW